MKRIATALLAFALVSGRLSAQVALVSATTFEPLRETVSVGYVMIPFTVLGTKGSPITDLRAPEVRLYVDGSSVRSDLFEKSQNAPVSFTILLEARRMGGDKNGRTYTITVKAKDRAGNIGKKAVTVTVPHNQ